MKAWKKFEADAAAIFRGKRYWAHAGERVDFIGETICRGERNILYGQCKLVKSLSLEALTKLAEEPGVDVVCVKVRRGRGKPSPMLVVFTEENYRRLHCDSISSAHTEAPCAPSSPSLPSQLAANTYPLPTGPIPFSAPTTPESFVGRPSCLRGPSAQ